METMSAHAVPHRDNHTRMYNSDSNSNKREKESDNPGDNV